MYGLRVAILIAISFILSCKPSEKRTENPFEIIEAHWSTWAGGQPGIGGNRYDVQIAFTQTKEVFVRSLKVDGREIPLSGVEQSHGIILISAIENMQNLGPSESLSKIESRPSFRVNNPDNAELTVEINQKKYITPLSFEKK